MPCYEPLIRIEDLNKWVKAADGHLYHPAKIQKASHILGERLEDTDYRNSNFLESLAHIYGYTTIPCGKCIGCKLDYSREWANRGYLEAQLWEQNWFVTLTYDEDHIKMIDDETATLEPEKITYFMKNLRQIMKREFNQDNIRFMACGEYGEERSRPHYHLIIFNLNLPVETFYNPRIKNNNCYWQNTIIERSWGGIRNPTKDHNYINPNSIGISNISECTWNNIAYTARYITKKINGDLEKEAYSENQEKEFFRVSRMPGIGQTYYEEHKNDIYKLDCITVKNQQGVINSKPPKYFDKLYKQEYPEEFKKIEERRKKQMISNNLIKDETYSYGRLGNLQVEADYKQEQTQKLIRSLERANQNL